VLNQKMQSLTDKASLAAVSSGTAKPVPADTLRFRVFFALAGIILLCFALPIYNVVRLALTTEIHSHILLIPFISLYLLNLRRAQLPPTQAGPVALCLATAVLPAALLATPLIFPSIGASELLSLRILAAWMLVVLLTAAVLGTPFFRAVIFPLSYLIFAVPLPNSVIDVLETLSKIASTEAYAAMMDLTQSTYFRSGFIFALPGLTIEVAQECSGIRSSLVLFIVSILAANLFLTTTWRRVLFCLFVIPLGILRNGFRIWTLSFLSVQWDPSVIHSPLHHKGGPLFFALSLIPFCLVLAWLRKTELRRLPKAGSSAPGATTV
jgi:exosortase C (VPDSG-CTERM-specific)